MVETSLFSCFQKVGCVRALSNLYQLKYAILAGASSNIGGAWHKSLAFAAKMRG